jgi:hypothetical protein
MHPTRTITLLLASNATLLLIIAALITTGFTKQTQKELSVERLNIVGPDGKPMMVLAGKGSLPGPSMNGKTYPASVSEGRDLMAGMIFFNESGDEVGGLVYNSFLRPDGKRAGVGHLSFDQFKQNQVVAIQYIENANGRRAGLNVWDRPATVDMDKELDLIQEHAKAGSARKTQIGVELNQMRSRGELGVQRLFVGSRDGAAQVQLRDKEGKVRVQLVVDDKGDPKLEFLDAEGKVTASLP